VAEHPVQRGDQPSTQDGGGEVAQPERQQNSGGDRVAEAALGDQELDAEDGDEQVPGQQAGQHHDREGGDAEQRQHRLDGDAGLDPLVFGQVGQLLLGGPHPGVLEQHSHEEAGKDTDAADGEHAVAPAVAVPGEQGDRGAAEGADQTDDAVEVADRAAAVAVVERVGDHRVGDR
jgi:hypothetical protein